MRIFFFNLPEWNEVSLHAFSKRFLCKFMTFVYPSKTSFFLNSVNNGNELSKFEIPATEQTDRQRVA